MKIKIDNYIFNKTTKEISFLDYNTISLDSILLITNVVSNTIIYNFADPLKGGSVNNNVLTLIYDTSSMNDNDKLQIFYDNGLNQSSEIKQEELNNLIETLQYQIENDDIIQRQLLSLLKPLSIISNGSYRLNLDVNNITSGTLTSVGTITTVTTVATVTNVTNFGGIGAFNLQKNIAHGSFSSCVRNNITF